MLNKNEINQNLIQELIHKQSSLKNNSEPPSDLPPTLTNGSMLNEESKKLLKTLENKYKEFFQVGEDLSGKADMLPDIIDGILSNLDSDIVLRMPDQGLAFTLFMQEIMNAAQYLSILSDPVPMVSAKIKNLSNMYLLDIKQTFVDLRQGLVDTNYNKAFKIRAIQCVLLTMALGKLHKSKDILNKVDTDIFSFLVNLLISPLQRLAQLGIFVKDSIEIFKSLQSCSNLTEFDKEIIAETLIILDELLVRSKLIGIVANDIKEATDLVAMDTLEKRFSIEALQQLEFFKKLVPTYVQLTMEAEFNSQFLSQITEALNVELASNLTLESAKFYRKLCRLTDSSDVELGKINTLKVTLKKELCAIHENTTFNDESKLERMKETVKTTYSNVTKDLISRSSFFSTPQSTFEKKLKSLIDTEMNAKSNAPQLS